MRRVQTNESNQCDLRGSLFAWLVCFLIKIISPGSRFGVFLVFGEALGKVPGLICSSQAVPRLAVGDGKEVATIGFKGFHSVSSWNRLMRTDAVSFVVWWMPSTARKRASSKLRNYSLCFASGNASRSGRIRDGRGRDRCLLSACEALTDGPDERKSAESHDQMGCLD